MRTLIWFRRDLRLQDNPALYQASVQAKQGVVALFVVTPTQWAEHDDADCKVAFWLENLKLLSADLWKLGIPLIVKSCDSFSGVPKVIKSVIKKNKCDALYFNREYEVNEVRRDTDVEAVCAKADISVHKYHDRIVVPPNLIKTKEGKFYSVFTPFRKVWQNVVTDYLETSPKPKKQAAPSMEPSAIPNKVQGFDLSKLRMDLWKPGEKEAAKRLKKFADRIGGYDDQRDLPSINGTSLLSSYLAAGVISPRQCLAAAIASNGGKVVGKQGPTTWISELAWRDFYAHIMVACPRVSKHLPFKLKTEKLDWRDERSELEAWQQGQTGFPIVDAGMRQLNRTGWMHNRLRMVTAMFLTKNLLIDWRLGEKYFMQKLIDGDLAANNGGWQWSASTGTDAVPYFRIFNPFSQSKRFDVDGKFIKQMCPELEKVPAKSLHDPKKLRESITSLGIDYPDFVVDYPASRTRALAAFKAL